MTVASYHYYPPLWLDRAGLSLAQSSCLIPFPFISAQELAQVGTTLPEDTVLD